MDLLKPPSTTSRKIVLWVVGVAVVLYTCLLIKEVGATAGGSDSSGYLNHARLMAEGRFHLPPREIEGLNAKTLPLYAYVPLGFTADPDTRDLIPTYSPGLPLFIVALRSVAGWNHAADLAMILHALAGIWLFYLLAREFGLDEVWSLVGSVVVATCPVYLFMSLQAMSDVPAQAWTTAALLMAWKSRRHAAWAIGAGLAVGIAVLVRPTSPLIMLPVALCLGVSPTRWAALILGGIPAGLFWMAHNHSLYGHAFITGYGDVRSSFAWAYAKLTIPAYAKWIPTMFTPLAVLFLLLPAAWSENRQQGIVLYVWGLLFPAFYFAYYCTNETWWYERFNLPSFPALVVGGLIVVRYFGRRWVKAFSPALAWAAVAAILVSNALWAYEKHAIDIGAGERSYEKVTTWLKANLPANSVLGVMQMSGAVYYYTDFTILRWDQIQDGGYPKAVKGIEAAHLPFYAVLYPFEQESALHERMPGSWTFVTKVRDASIYKYTPGTTPPPS